MGCDHFLISGDGFEEKWYFGNWFVLVWVWYCWCGIVLIDRYLLNLTPTSLLPRMQPGDAYIFFVSPKMNVSISVVFSLIFVKRNESFDVLFTENSIQLFRRITCVIKPMEFVELFVMCCCRGLENCRIMMDPTFY